MTTPASAYIETRNELDAKRGQLAAALAKARTGTGPKGEPIYDLSKASDILGSGDQVAEVKRRQTEIEDLARKLDVLGADEALKGWDERFGTGRAPDHETPLPIGDRTDDAPKAKSIGELLVKTAEFEAFRKDKRPFGVRIPMDLKTLFQTTAGLTPQSTRSGVYTYFPTRPLAVADFLPTVRWNQAAYKYVEETTFTNLAAEKAEGIAYAESAFVYTEKSETVQKLTNSLPVTDEQLDDVEGILQILEDRLQFQVRQKLDAQILVGDGISPNLKGTENVTGIQTQALGTDSTADAIFKLLRQIRDNGFAEPEVVFIAPSKWQTHRIAKTADGIYLNGSPSEVGPDTIWGLPVVQTTAHTATKAIAGAYRAHSLLAVRSDLTLEIGYVNDDFTKGKKTIRAEIRCAVIHYRPKAFGNVTGL